MPFTITDPGPTAPIFSDDFSTDTRANYTYTSGAQANFAVAAGELQDAAPTGTTSLASPTALAAREDAILVARVKGVSGAFSGFGARIVDASNWLYLQLDASGSQIVIGTTVAGASATQASAAISGFSAATYYYLFGIILGPFIGLAAYTTDPELGGPTQVASCSWVSPAAHALGAGISGRMGIKSLPNSTTGFRWDTFKVWSAGAHAFNF